MDAAFLFPRGAKKLPAAKLLLLRQLLALLRLIGQHVSSSRMTCSSLAVCLGPKLLSPPQEQQLELEAMLAENKQANALVDIPLENSGDIFGEQVAGPNESPAPTELCTEMHREEQSGPAGREDNKPQAESNLDASPSLPETWQGDGEEATVLEVQRAEAPPALSPNTHQSPPESLAKAEALTSLSVSGSMLLNTFNDSRDVYNCSFQFNYSVSGYKGSDYAMKKYDLDMCT
ncbi:T-cell activation Rho GTPase-activating protein-like [Aphelocoma coerulescens]|uniref:T-cell activation Rho GTPase-activating protein-like n=1 Tax=Aphelocoma coerulescens TaxID=39617 RepID=UPI003604C217